MLEPFYNRFPSLGNLKAQMVEKQSTYAKETRAILTDSLHNQYKNVAISEATQTNLSALSKSNTFTITTGHQLNIFTGPLYFLYKIVSTINLAKELKQVNPENHYVPVYWMATEDHDFEEINYFTLNGKKIRWNAPAAGPVGMLATEGLDEVFHLFSQELGLGKDADYLKALFSNAYLSHTTLTEATRYLVNELFGAYGLVIVDGNDSALKRLFIPYMKTDIFQQEAYHKVTESCAQLSAVDATYPIQVNPREINLFYLKKGSRERLVREGDYFKVLNTSVRFSEEMLHEELEQYPERFSPNVILRPLYQEVVLPNLCYIGGGGEIAYWLELKSFFEASQVPFPILLLRNSALLIPQKVKEKLNRMEITNKQLFLKRDAFINRKVREISNIDIDFSPQRKALQEQFEYLYSLAEQTDLSFMSAVKAQEVKQLKGLNALEKRLLKAQKRKLADQVTRMTDLQNQLFPGKALQERTDNFSQHYLQFGPELIPALLTHLKPLEFGFAVLVL